MAGGFTSPAILFLSTWDLPERSFCAQVFRDIAKRGTYTRYIEPCAGGFAMPLVAANAGIKPEMMVCSDTSLFSAIVGTMLSGGDFEALDMRFDGEPIEIEGATHVEKAAHLLWAQLRARMLARPDVEYWRAMQRDVENRKAQHQASLTKRLQSYMDRLGGSGYEARDMWSHIESVMDDPKTVISINPPTYKGGFERFFDTKDRLTWAEPPYEIFDPITGIPRLVEMMEGKAALLLCQQQREPGQSAHPRPVFGRHLSIGQYVYLNSNRPDEVFDITGGFKVAPMKSADLTPLNVPILPIDYDVREDSKVVVMPIKASVADYYRGLWMHRLKADPGTMNLLVLVDGYAAGVIGYNTAAMVNPYQADAKWARHAILRFAFGAPHETLRMTRLATMVALRRETIGILRTPTNAIYLSACEGLVTVEYTRHPEAKGLRGLMKRVDRTPHPDGYRLIYAADWSDASLEDTVKSFVTKESTWLKQRQQTPA